MPQTYMAQNDAIDAVKALKLQQKHLQDQIHDLIVAFQRNTGFAIINVEINRHPIMRFDADFLSTVPFEVLVEVALP